MVKELGQLVEREVFHPTRFSELPYDERRLIVNSTAAYKEKFKADGAFEKSKSRLLVRGDMQKEEYSGESSYPTARVDTMLALLARANLRNREVFSVDFVAAYPNSERPDFVQHKHVYLDKEIVALLVDIKPDWAEYVQPDGRMLTEMDRMLYGYKEAGLLWNEILVEMFVKHGFKVADADPCLLTLRRGEEEADLTISTDDCLFSVTSDSLKQELIQLCRDTFREITVQEGDTFSHFGM